MATKLPAADVVTIGLGWTGSMVAKSMTDADLRVVWIERGPWRDTATDFPPSYSPDELRYAVKYDLCVRPTQTTITDRPSASLAVKRRWRLVAESLPMSQTPVRADE
jgi:gluconate 2-dehydrogenase alpha chain